MLNTKDVAGYMAPFAGIADRLWAISVPGQTSTLPASETAAKARSAGIEAVEAPDVADAVRKITRDTPDARIVICGSLYLAGEILAENG
jgi:dihydrofolate synthase/folylpolyglutamate synthase